MIVGLLFPPFIKRLDFKSKEELQQMPQTEEEHLENQNLDYEDQEKQHPDAEVCFIFAFVVLLMLFFFSSLFLFFIAVSIYTRCASSPPHSR